MSLRLPDTQTIWVSGVCALLAVLLGLLAGLDAKLAISASLGLAFTLVALADLSVGLALFTFLGFIVVVPNFAGDTLSVLKIAALPLLISWLALISRERSGRETLVGAHPAFSWTMVALIAWSTLSFLWSEDGGATRGAVFRYALAAILVFIVYTAVQRERDVRLIATAMVVGAVAAAAYGFLNPAPEEYGQLSRLGGTLGNPNELASVLIIGIGLSGGLAMAARGPLSRLAAIGAGGICLVAILLTGSRGGLFALAAMLVAAVLFARGRRLKFGMAALVVVLVGLGYVLMVAPPQSKERILHPGSGSGRTDIWTVGTRMVAAHPLEGVGAGNFPSSSIHYLLRPGALEQDQYIADSPKVAENMYLEVLAELGIPGLALLLAIIGFSFVAANRALTIYRRLDDRRMQALAIAFVVSIFGLLVADFFASKQYARELWLLIGMGPALLAMAKRAEAGDGA